MLCAYCGESLGCSKHEVSIEEHVAATCIANDARRLEVDAAAAGWTGTFSGRHPDTCWCMLCCSEKFKTIDPARFGKAPRECHHTLYDARCDAAREDD